MGLIKVCHFVLDPRVGGPHIYIGSLTRTLGSRMDSLLVTAGRGPKTDFAIVNLRHHMRWLYPLEVVLNILLVCWRWRRRSSRKNVIFDVHGAANLAPIVASRILRIPFVWHFHETVAGFRSIVWLAKKACTGTQHHIVVVASKAAKVFQLPNATLIPGTADIQFWSPLPGPQEATADSLPAPFKILAIGNLNPLKGMDILLDALTQMNVAVKVVIVGSSLQTHAAYAASLRRKAAKFTGTDCCVEFMGWQSPDVIRGLMQHTDVFVLPSRSEACPLALLEAMASGCTCVASDVGDVRDILEIHDSGFVVPSESSRDLAGGLKMAYQIGRLGRQQMGQRARKTIIERYSCAQLATQHITIYESLLRHS